ncbi:MAG: hypothetical protein V2I65_04550 [Paracoccaceae bacterium]|jgi:hypothetical protein|nr:hypothetical protein [Paracoccaceae bacterium]
MGRTAVAVAALAGAVLFAGSWTYEARAATTFNACTGTFAGLADGLTPNVGCAGITGVSNDSAGVLNTAPGLFGLTDWVFLGRDNTDSEAGDIDLLTFTGTGNTQGTFSFTPSLVNGYQSVAIVLKSGASAEPCGIAGYLLGSGVTSGSFSSPFLCPSAQPEDISHATLYGSTTSLEPIPLPGALGLLVAGMGMVAAMRRTSRRAPDASTA